LVFAITEMRSHRRIRDASRIALVRPGGRPVQVNEFDRLYVGRETPNGVVSTDVPGGATDGIVVCGGLIGIGGLCDGTIAPPAGFTGCATFFVTLPHGRGISSLGTSTEQALRRVQGGCRG
jgi:hypothetical protein